MRLPKGWKKVKDATPKLINLAGKEK